ncbi:MAG TPA: hypothetical protein VM659_09465 [Dongiaceae bacterium]|nr:hypothetical protein [Dongiaceae bacterium]
MASATIEHHLAMARLAGAVLTHLMMREREGARIYYVDQSNKSFVDFTQQIISAVTGGVSSFQRERSKELSINPSLADLPQSDALSCSPIAQQKSSVE